MKTLTRKKRATGDVAPPLDKKIKRSRKNVNDFLAKHGVQELYEDKHAAKLMQRFLELKAQAKTIYGVLDGITAELMKKQLVGRVVKLSRGRAAILKDEFEEKHVIFRAHATRRYEVHAFGEDR